MHTFFSKEKETMEEREGEREKGMEGEKGREMKKGKEGCRDALKQTCSAKHRLTVPFIKSGSHISLTSGPFVGLTVLFFASALNVWTSCLRKSLLIWLSRPF